MKNGIVETNGSFSVPSITWVFAVLPLKGFIMGSERVPGRSLDEWMEPVTQAKWFDRCCMVQWIWDISRLHMWLLAYTKETARCLSRLEAPTCLTYILQTGCGPYCHRAGAYPCRTDPKCRKQFHAPCYANKTRSKVLRLRKELEETRMV